MEGHINTNNTSNCKYCNIRKSTFKLNVEHVESISETSETKDSYEKKPYDKSVLHQNIKMKILDEHQITMAVGALGVNPNMYERISYDLEEIQKSANIDTKPA